jgi:predicted outer membrane protein
MRLRQSRPVLTVCGIAALSPLIACAPYSPAPGPGASAFSTEPAVVDVEETSPPSAETETETEAEAETETEAETEAEAEPEPETGTWQTTWGPLTETDRKLITGVRLASLWEMPMAQDAVQRASTSRVRAISKEIAEQHHTLDEQVRDVAAKLKVKLPVTPTDEQQEWMNDISSKSGSAYDATYVKWLRLAHGKVFALIGTVRGSTQNTLVRRFSEQANAAVLNHQRLLESTGLTTAESFPTPSG